MTSASQLYGYARISTTDQDLSIQDAALRAAGCTIIRAEKVTGTTRESRSEFATLMDFMRRGDQLMVTRVDRLARFIGDSQDIVRTLKARGVTLRATDRRGCASCRPKASNRWRSPSSSASVGPRSIER